MSAKNKNSVSLIVLLLFALIVGYANYAFAGGKGGKGGSNTNQQDLYALQVYASQHRGSTTTSGNQ